jgi:hypothetical protein
MFHVEPPAREVGPVRLMTAAPFLARSYGRIANW